MEEQVQAQEAQPEQQPEVQAPEVDLVTRVSQVQPKEQKQEEQKFNINELDAEIEKVQESPLKEQFLKLKKSLISGENKKYEEIANLRKEYEKKISDISSWTPERLKEELSKPDFVQAANTVLQSGNPQGSGLSDEQWSALSDADKSELRILKQKISMLEQSNFQAVKTQQDSTLKTKYANYAPDIIDNALTQMNTGKLQITREDIWKAIDYEKAVKRAYELGLVDKNTQNKEKVNAMSFDGSGNISAPSGVERKEGESISDFMVRSYAEHSKKK